MMIPTKIGFLLFIFRIFPKSDKVKTMAITKTISIDGMDVPFKASAAVPRMYRLKFRRDIYKDFSELQKDFKDNGEKDTEKKSEISIENLEVFENIAYIMAKHADPENVPANPDDWLEQFSMFSIYEVLPELIELWGMNVETQAVSKKKFAQLTGK